MIRTDRVAAAGPNGADLWWSGKHKHHGGNVQVVAAPDGWPLGVSPVRPGREHDTTCARAHGLVDAPNRLAATLGIPTLTDLGYENIGAGFRHPVKKPKGGELSEPERTFNAVIRGVHRMAKRANALRKVTFKALRSLSGEGLVALAPLALACMAHDADIPIEVQSEYMPIALLRRSWVGEYDT